MKIQAVDNTAYKKASTIKQQSDNPNHNYSKSLLKTSPSFKGKRSPEAMKYLRTSVVWMCATGVFTIIAPPVAIISAIPTFLYIITGLSISKKENHDNDD